MRSDNKTPEHGDQPADVPAPLVAAIRRLLRPLIKLLVARGITYPYFANLLKGLFVEVAEHEFPVSGRPQTDSRISLLSGVHRKDVRRLRTDSEINDAPPASVSMGAQVIARWVSEKRYVDTDGAPKVLPLRAARGASFEELVAAVSRQDVRPRAVLDELRRLNIVAVNEDGQVTLQVDAFVPQSGFEEKAFFFGRNLADHMSAAAHNLGGAEEPFLERAVSYHHLSERDIESLRQESHELGMQTLKVLNKRAMTLAQRNRRKAEAGGALETGRMSFGVYFFSDQDKEDHS